ALISATISVTLQSTDRHHGIVGQKHGHFQGDSCTRPTEPPEPGGSHRAFQKQRASPSSGHGSPRSRPGVVVVGNRGRPSLAPPPRRGHLVCVRPKTGRGSRDTQRVCRPPAPRGACRVFTQRLAGCHAHVGTPHL